MAESPLTASDVGKVLTEAPNGNGFEVTVKSRGKTDWLGIGKVIGATLGMMGGGAGLLSMTKPDQAIADNARITAVAKQADEATTRATEAKATADKAIQKVDVLADKVADQTRALDKTNEKLDAQAAQLNQLIGVLKVLAK